MLESVSCVTQATAVWRLLQNLTPALRIGAGWRAPIAEAMSGQGRPVICRVVTAGTTIDAAIAGRLAAQTRPQCAPRLDSQPEPPPEPQLEVRCLIRPPRTVHAPLHGSMRRQRIDFIAGGERAGQLEWRMTDVPLPQMCIVGGALLIFERPQGGQAGWLVSPNPAADDAISLQELTFDAIWYRAGAGASDGHLDRDPTGLPADLHRVLQQLATGATDRKAQRHTNLSPRTFSRKVAELMQLLGAASRFQAGAEAAFRGWVHPRSG